LYSYQLFPKYNFSICSPLLWGRFRYQKTWSISEGADCAKAHLAGTRYIVNLGESHPPNSFIQSFIHLTVPDISKTCTLQNH
jgi:hypothetical protein